MALSAVTAITALLAVLPADPALAAPPITCDMTVTTSIRLTRDLTCPGSGLTIRSDNITVDLGGHTLTGPGDGGAGISVDGASGIRIVGGTITNFHQAITMDGAWVVALQHLRLVGNRPTDIYATLHLFESGNIEVLDSQILQPAGLAIFAENVERMRMERLQVSGRFTWWWSEMIHLAHSTLTDAELQFIRGSGGTVWRNDLRRSSIEVSEGGVTVAENHFAGPVATAVSVSQASGITLDRNVISGAGRGLFINHSSLRGARITQNVFRDNDYGAVLVESDLTASSILVSDNSFVGNREAGLFVEAVRAPAGAAVSVTRNTFIRNGHRGIDRDSAGRPINDGLHTNIPIGTRLVVSHNRTYRNAGHGIEALPTGSVIDGGGNRSVGDRNGCAGVICA